eukprot:1158883-Pelagomonas_calceolata.AAC.9
MSQSNFSVDSGPCNALARSRKSVAQAKNLLRREWQKERAATFQGAHTFTKVSGGMDFEHR